MPDRRSFLAASALAAAGLAPLRAAAPPRPPYLPVSGPDSAALAPFDDLMTSFVRDHKVPGASLAVSRHGKLVYARGFGYADVKKKLPVQPDALFRVASVSKPITAVAVMQLVEQKKLRLDEPVLGRVKLEPLLPRGAKVDPRWHKVSVRHCLRHTGGWDRDRSFDPIGRPWEIAKALGAPTPVRPADVVRYMMGRPLDFDPGERVAYSNLGYLVLGRLIEAVTGKGYEGYVRERVFGPLKLHGPRLGRALAEDRAKGEVRYYDRHKRSWRCLYPPKRNQHVPLPDGAENFEAFEAHGGWIASAVDLVRFASAFDDPARCPLLGEAAIKAMWARPEGATGRDGSGRPLAAFLGCGWMVRPVGNEGKVNAWHTGYIAGTEALLVRRWDNLNWAVLFNTQSSPRGASLAGMIDGRLHEAAAKVRKWPEADLEAATPK